MLLLYDIKASCTKITLMNDAQPESDKSLASNFLQIPKELLKLPFPAAFGNVLCNYGTVQVVGELLVLLQCTQLD